MDMTKVFERIEQLKPDMIKNARAAYFLSELQAAARGRSALRQTRKRMFKARA